MPGTLPETPDMPDMTDMREPEGPAGNVPGAAGRDAVSRTGKPAAAKPVATTHGLPQSGTVAGGVEFEIERAKGDADEVIDPEQLNLF